MGAQYTVVMFGQTGHEVELMEKLLVLVLMKFIKHNYIETDINT